MALRAPCDSIGNSRSVTFVHKVLHFVAVSSVDCVAIMRYYEYGATGRARVKWSSWRASESRFGIGGSLWLVVRIGCAFFWKWYPRTPPSLSFGPICSRASAPLVASMSAFLRPRPLPPRVILQNRSFRHGERVRKARSKFWNWSGPAHLALRSAILSACVFISSSSCV